MSLKVTYKIIINVSLKEVFQCLRPAYGLNVMPQLDLANPTLELKSFTVDVSTCVFENQVAMF